MMSYYVSSVNGFIPVGFSFLGVQGGFNLGYGYIGQDYMLTKC